MNYRASGYQKSEISSAAARAVGGENRPRGIRLLTFAVLAVSLDLNGLNAAPTLSGDLTQLRELQATVTRVCHEAIPAVVFVGNGSGVIISADGLVLTNDHVMEPGILDEKNRTTIVFSISGTRKSCLLLGRCPGGDLALLKIEDPGPHPYLKVGDSDSLRAGQQVIAIGNPFLLASNSANPWIHGLAGDFHPSVSLGVVSATHRFAPPKYPDAIQVDAALNPGNSGGPLLTLDGKIVGINGKIETRMSLNINSGVGYAVPSNLAKRFLEPLEAAAGGEVPSGVLSGLEIRVLNENSAPGAQGVTIAGIQTESDASRIGLLPGDLILKVNDLAVRTAGRLQGILRTYPVGAPLKIELRRGGSELCIITEFRSPPQKK